MFRLQFFTATALGMSLLLSGCGVQEKSPNLGSTASLETTDPEPPKSDVAAQLTIELTGSAPTATDVRSIEVSGSLVTGGTLTAHLEPGETVALLIVGQGNITTRAQLDQSIPVLVSEQFELGIGPPNVATPSGENASFDWDSKQDGSKLTYTLTLSPDSPAATVTLPVGTDAALDAVWTSAEGGRSLQVSPSEWGRTGGMTVVEFGWQSVLALEPEADSDSMNNQFQCHVLGAPTKTYWNLEPRRPDVGLLRFMAERCNP